MGDSVFVPISRPLINMKLLKFLFISLTIGTTLGFTWPVLFLWLDRNPPDLVYGILDPV